MAKWAEIEHIEQAIRDMEQTIAMLREAYRLPRLTDDVCAELRIAYVDHDDNRDEALAAVIEWYLRARALNSGGQE